jgi:hypothetical protein
VCSIFGGRSPRNGLTATGIKSSISKPVIFRVLVTKVLQQGRSGRQHRTLERGRGVRSPRLHFLLKALAIGPRQGGRVAAESGEA